MTLYMAVTPDELELPMFVTNNSKEMAKRFRTTQNSVMPAIGHGSSGKMNGVKFVRVKIEGE